MNLKKWEGFYE